MDIINKNPSFPNYWSLTWSLQGRIVWRVIASRIASVSSRWSCIDDYVSKCWGFYFNSNFGKVLNLSVGGCHTLVQDRAPISHRGQLCNTRLQLHHQDFYNSCGPLDPSSDEYGAFERTTSDTFFQRPWYLRSHCSLILEESPPGSQAGLYVKIHQFFIPMSMLLFILLTFASWLVRVCLAHSIG